MRIFPSTLTTRCIKIVVTSLYVSAYFNRFRRMRHSGRHSRDLWGPVKDEHRRETTRARSIGQSIRLLFLIPRVHRERETSPARPGRRHHSMKTLCARRIAPGDGFGAKTPPSLSSIQCLGALRRFKCFLSPLAMFLVRRQSFASRKGGARRRAAIDEDARTTRARPARARGWGVFYTHHRSRSLLNTRYSRPIDA